jgi:hypothetical protein
MDEHEKQAVSMPDLDAAINAARDRVRVVPASTNLIDSLSDDEWNNPEVDGWNITCGSDDSDPDELDAVDEEACKAA